MQEGELDIQGGIYDLEMGHVHFLGRSPFHASLKEDSSPQSEILDKIAGS